MKIKFTYLFIIFGLLHSEAKTQDTLPREFALLAYDNAVLTLAIQVDYGFIMVHRPSIDYLQKRHARSISCTFSRKTDGSKAWHSNYIFPEYGFTYRMMNLGSREVTGNGQAVCAQMVFPLNRNSKFSLQLKPDIGVAYVPRPFDEKSNYKNLAIGSKLNACIGLALQLKTKINRNLQFQSGISILHLSNGAAKVPNLGLNVPSVFMGLCYQLKKETLLFPPKSSENLKRKKHETGFYLASGIKEIYPPNGKAYPVAVLNLQRHYSVRQKGWMGAGTELMFDASLPAKRRADWSNDSLPVPFTPTFRSGAYASFGLQMGPWNAFLQTGLYLCNPVKSDGDIYNRLSVRYQLPSGVFFCINLKSHFGKADYAEWGAGYNF